VLYRSSVKLRSEMAVRELAERNGDGVVVQLFWNDSAPAGRDLYVQYWDERTEVFYVLYPTRDSALDAFYHPNAYAREQRERRRRPVAA
jgi:hypothetical protein